MSSGCTKAEIVRSLRVIQVAGFLPELHRRHGVMLHPGSGITAYSQHIKCFCVVLLRRLLEALHCQRQILIHPDTGIGKFTQTAQSFREIVFGRSRKILNSLLKVLLGADTGSAGLTHELLSTGIPQLRPLTGILHGFFRIFFRTEAQIIALSQMEAALGMLLFRSCREQLKSLFRALFATAETSAISKSQHRHGSSMVLFHRLFPPLTGCGSILLHTAASGICKCPQQIHGICMTGLRSLLPPLYSLDRISRGILVPFQTALSHLHHLFRRLRLSFSLLFHRRSSLRFRRLLLCPIFRTCTQQRKSCQCRYHQFLFHSGLLKKSAPEPGGPGAD